MRTIRPHEVVLFLQNPWFSPDVPTETVDAYRNRVEFRREYLKKTLTGGRLFRAFGEEWYNGMWIDNANPLHTSMARGLQLPDLSHMGKVVMDRLPLLVVTFGKVAESGWRQLCRLPGRGRYFKSLAHITGVHPNAMGVTREGMEAFAMKVMACQIE